MAPFLPLTNFIRAGEKSSRATCIEEGADKTYGIRLRLWIGPSVEKLSNSSWPYSFGVEEIFPQVRQCPLRTFVPEQRPEPSRYVGNAFAVIAEEVK